MNCIDLRKYFVSKYYQKYCNDYPDDRLTVELVLLKRLLKKYSFYTILDAIDQFIKVSNLDTARIFYFSKIFQSRFRNLIKIDEIVIYKRFLPFYEDDKEEVGQLLQEYNSYANALSLSHSEILRKKEILIILEEINAKRLRRKNYFITEGPKII